MGELAERWALPAAAAAGLTRLLILLEEDPAAPTTVTTPADALAVHLADSLVALDLEAVRGARVVADLGSGAGFPGLPLALALPEASVLLVESVTRRCEFLRRALRAAGVGNAEVVCARAEAWPAGRERCDLVCARAVGSLAVLAEYAAPLLTVGGSLVAWKGARSADEETAGAAAAAQVGLEAAEVVAVTPYPGSRARHLHRFVKREATPDRFPRRSGMARKRPLGRPR